MYVSPNDVKLLEFLYDLRLSYMLGYWFDGDGSVSH